MSCFHLGEKSATLELEQLRLPTIADQLSKPLFDHLSIKPYCSYQ